MGESQRLSPTAARTAAADSGLPRGRRALSGALHSDAQACATELAKRRLPSASLVPCPDSPQTASSDERVVPRTASPQTGHHKPKIPTKNTTRRNHHEDTTTKTKTWRPARPYIPPGFLLRPPSSSCGKLREKGRCPCPTLSPPRPLAARRVRGNRYMAQAKGDSFPQNEAPHLHDL